MSVSSPFHLCTKLSTAQHTVGYLYAWMHVPATVTALPDRTHVVRGTHASDKNLPRIGAVTREVSQTA